MDQLHPTEAEGRETASPRQHEALPMEEDPAQNCDTAAIQPDTPMEAEGAESQPTIDPPPNPQASIRVMGTMPIIRIGVALPSGSVLPITVHQGQLAGVLKQMVMQACGIPLVKAGTLGVAWGHVRLAEDKTILANDVQDSDLLSLYNVL